MKAAKTLVWVMSGMLVALLGVLVVGLSLGWHKDPAAPALAEPRADGRGFDAVNLGQPPGSTVAHIADAGGLLAVTLTGGGMPDRILLVNPHSGALAGEIQIEAAESPSSRQ